MDVFGTGIVDVGGIRRRLIRMGIWSALATSMLEVAFIILSSSAESSGIWLHCIPYFAE